MTAFGERCRASRPRHRARLGRPSGAHPSGTPVTLACDETVTCRSAQQEITRSRDSEGRVAVRSAAAVAFPSFLSAPSACSAVKGSWTPADRPPTTQLRGSQADRGCPTRTIRISPRISSQPRQERSLHEQSSGFTSCPGQCPRGAVVRGAHEPAGLRPRGWGHSRRRRQPARPVFVDGQAQIVPAFEDEKLWIRQTLFVETEFDSDGDGRRDRMFVDVTRPRQTDTEGLKVPVLYESSPYFAGTSGNRQFLWDVKQELGEPPPPRTSQAPIAFKATRENVSTSLVATWVPRGFAVVHSDAPGTGLSQGCPTVGSDPEQLAPKAVIDWLNGRAKGFTTIDGNEPVVATVVVHGQGRDDRHVLQRDDPARRRGHRRQGPRGHHSRRAEHVVLPLLPVQRSRAPPWRLARRGHRLSLRLHQQRRPGAARVLQPHVSRRRVRARARSGARRLQRVLGRARPAEEGRPHQGRGVHGPRLQRLERGAGTQRSHLRGAQGARAVARLLSPGRTWRLAAARDDEQVVHALSLRRRERCRARAKSLDCARGEPRDCRVAGARRASTGRCRRAWPRSRARRDSTTGVLRRLSESRRLARDTPPASGRRPHRRAGDRSRVSRTRRRRSSTTSTWRVLRWQAPRPPSTGSSSRRAS